MFLEDYSLHLLKLQLSCMPVHPLPVLGNLYVFLNDEFNDLDPIFRPIVAPALRSITSKLIPSDERGTVFALLSVCDNAVPLISGVLYSQIYLATMKTYPAAIFWLTISSQVLVFSCIM